jgi:hypothetical protein
MEMKGKYLITTDHWFIAPDGKQYRSAWGEVVLMDDKILGIKTNRMASNWYAMVGGNDREIIIAGCQIHFAIKCPKKPDNSKMKDYQVDVTKESGKVEYERESYIYIAE